jgi:hypothetical protein
VSSVTTPWTTVTSNLIPNQGDYLGLYANDSYVAYAWADGRNGRPDIYTAKLNQSFTAGCGSDATVASNTLFNFSDQVSNASVMFPYGLNYTLTANRNWPGLPQTGSLTVAASGITTLPFSVQVPDTAADGIVHLCLTSTLPSGCLNSSCCLNLTVFTPPVATLASLVSASAEGGQVRLQWEVSVAGAVSLYRSSDGASWTRIGQLVPDGTSRVSYVDANVTSGARYGYRLGVPSGGGEVMAGETWVNVPRTAVFALQGAQPNPAAGALSFSFSLANDRGATLQLLDLAGRRVFERQVGGLGAGFHIVRYDGVKLPAGMYVIRLTQAGQTLTGKVAVVH